MDKNYIIRDITMNRSKYSVFKPSITNGTLYREEVLLDKCRMPYFNTNLLYVSGYGESFFKPGGNFDNFIPYWALNLLCKGCMTYRINGETHTLFPGDIYISPPGIPLNISIPKDTTLMKRYIMFNSGPLPSLLINHGPLSGRHVLHGLDISEIKKNFDEMKSLASKGADNLQKRLSDLMYAIITDMVSQCGEPSPINNFESALKTITSSPGTNYTLPLLAKQFNTGKRTLCRLFKKHLGYSPMHYITKIRMDYAAWLLSSNTLSISAIAEECGYSSLNIFSQKFKKHYGMSPKHYRGKDVITENECRRVFATFKR